MKTHLFRILAAIGLLYTSSLSAQRWSAGVRGGLSIPNLTTAKNGELNPLNSGYRSRLGTGFGVFMEYQVDKLFSIQALLVYSQQGGKKNGFQAFPVPPQIAPFFANHAPLYLYADFNSKAKLDYLMLPALARFGWNPGSKNKWRIYGGAGPFASVLLTARQITTGNSPVYLDQRKTQPVPADPSNPSAGTLTLPFNNSIDIGEQLRPFNFGLEGNLGLRYYTKRNAVFLEGGANYGFLNLQKGSGTGKNKPGSATIMLGYAYRF